MRIRVEKIPSGGTARSIGLDVGWAREAAAVAMDGVPTALSGKITIEAPQGRLVDVLVKAAAVVDGTCDRCGDPVTRSVDTEISLRYLPASTESSSSPPDIEIELVQDDLDIGWYEDGSLVLADVLTEALALAIPNRTLCEDQSSCEARTNALLEAAKLKEVGHPAFAALKNLKN